MTAAVVTKPLRPDALLAGIVVVVMVVSGVCDLRF